MLYAAHQTSSWEEDRKQRAPTALRRRSGFSSEHLPVKLVGIFPNSASVLRLAAKAQHGRHPTLESSHPLTSVPRRPAASLPHTFRRRPG